MPDRRVRQWRGLIAFRRGLRDQRTATKNQIRSLLLSEGIEVPLGQGLWSQQGQRRLSESRRSLDCTEMDNLWRGQLAVLLEQLSQIEAHIATVDAKLDDIGKADSRVIRLKTVPGVGPRLAEAVVALIDRPERFRNGRQLGAYIGMVPRQYQSGNRDVRGGITKRGNTLVRSLLVEIAWAGLRNNAWMRSVYNRVCRGAKTRRNIAIIAVARRLLVLTVPP